MFPVSINGKRIQFNKLILLYYHKNKKYKVDSSDY